MKEKQEQSLLIQWLFPACVFFAVLGIVLYNYAVAQNDEISKTLTSTLISSANEYADEATYKIQSIVLAEQLTAGLIGSLSDQSNTQKQKLLTEMQEKVQAYMAVYVNTAGNGIRENGSPVEVDVPEFYGEASLETSQVLYLEDDGVTGNVAVAVTCPVMNQEQAVGIVITFYNAGDILSHMEQTRMPDTGAWYAVVTGDGTVVDVSGKETQYLKPNVNLYEYLKDYYTETRGEANFSKARESYQQGNFLAALDGQERTVFYTPLRVDDWYFLMGASESYIAFLSNNRWEPTQNLIIFLSVAIGLFFITVAVINIVNKTKLNSKSKDLEEKADMDLLTELSNKIATERKIIEYMEQNPEQQCLMFVLDIDNFKKINDTMGHAFGDEVLRTLGLQLRAEFRVTDIIGRTGGDEFIIFLKNIKDEAVLQKEANRVAYFFKHFKAGEYTKYSATASIGCAVFPKDGANFPTLYKAADSALYRAKRRGKNQLAFYQDEYEAIQEPVKDDKRVPAE